MTRKMGLWGVIIASLTVFAVVAWTIASAAGSRQAEGDATIEVASATTTPWDESLEPTSTPTRSPSSTVSPSSATPTTADSSTSPKQTQGDTTHARHSTYGSSAASRSASTTVASAQSKSTRASTTSSRAAQQPSASKAQQVLALVNTERTARGLSALTSNSCLTNKASQPWAQHLADTRTFTHQELSPIRSKCSGLKTLGENIAKGQRTPAAVVDAWMNSSGHRANILSDSYTSMGLGLATDSAGSLYWVQNFGG